MPDVLSHVLGSVGLRGVRQGAELFDGELQFLAKRGDRRAAAGHGRQSQTADTVPPVPAAAACPPS